MDQRRQSKTRSCAVGDRTTASVVVVLTVLAGALWSYRLGGPALWRDEAATASITQRTFPEMWRVIVGHEANMALYDVILWGWRHLGSSEGLLRLPSLLFAVVTIPTTALVARRVGGNLAAVIAALVLSSSPLLAEQATELRSYSLVAFLSAASTLAFLRAVERRRRREWAVWALLAAALPYTHLLAALVPVAQIAALLVIPARDRPARAAALACLGAAALVAPLTLMVAGGDLNRTSWIGPMTLQTVGATGMALAGGAAALLLTGVCVAVLCRSLVTGGRSEERRFDTSLTLAVALLPGALVVAASLLSPQLQTRYLIGSLPALAVLAGAAVAALSSATRAALAGMLAIVSIIGLLTREHPPDRPEDLRAAAATIAVQTRRGDVIGYAPAFARVGLGYYLGAERRRPDDASVAVSAVTAGDLFARESPPEVVARRLWDASRVWIVSYPGQDWHPTPEPVAVAAPAILRRGFVRQSDRRFGELRVELFAKRLGGRASP